MANKLARLSVRACGRLGGYLGNDLSTPENPPVRKSLGALLTPYLARKLGHEDASEVGASEVRSLIFEKKAT